MTTPRPQTHIHSTPLTTLVPHLLPHLPKSLPLLRRLQFHTSSPSALILATFHPSSTTTTAPPPTPFAAIWADRTRAPETECWLFSTYETLPSPPTPPQREEAKAQCLALLAGIARLPATTPLTVIGSLNESLLWLIGGEGVGGLVAQDVVSRDARGGDGAGTDTDTSMSKGRVGVIGGISVPYCKWLIAPPGRAAAGKEEQEHSLPPGYAFGKLGGDDELRLTIARTAIPKTVTTLAQLGNLGVRYIPKASNNTTTTTTTTPTPAGSETDREPQGELVAWAFLGVDGSLTSLHVEPAHRGQGLAKAVSRRLFRCLADDALAMGFRPVGGIGNGQKQENEAAREQHDEESDGIMGECGDGEGWAHSDVAEANVESAGVARGLGGKEGWRVRWVSVDLAAVAAVVVEGR